MFLCHETHANHASDANLDFSVHKLYENKAMTLFVNFHVLGFY